MPVYLACEGQIIVDGQGRPKCKTLDGSGNGDWYTYTLADMRSDLTPQLTEADADGLVAASILLLVTAFIFKSARKGVSNEKG